MTSLKTRPALATQSVALGNSVARSRNRRDAAGPTRRAPRLVCAWHAIKRAWLARRLARVEAELLAWTARAAGKGGGQRREISRQDLADYESCCMERAVLRAQIEHCRALS